MKTSSKDIIIKLLTEGKSSAEIIGMGYKAGTVYGAQRKWRQGQVKTRLTGDSPKATQHPSHPAKTSVSPVTDEIESDPEIVRLKKEIRKAELEKELGRAKMPSAVMVLVAAAKEIGELNFNCCPHNEDGICTVWSWNTEEEFPDGIAEPVYDDQGVCGIEPSVLYCAICPIRLEHTVE